MSAIADLDRVRREMKELGPWYHAIEIADGVTTPGRSFSKPKFDALARHLSDDIAGARVLDVGCNAGGLAVEFARRGAEVVGVEVQSIYHRQAMWISKVLGLGNFTPVKMPVYEIKDLAGQFDTVLFMGLIYHLRHPQLALDMAADKCRGDFFMSTPKVISDLAIMELRLPDGHEAIAPGREAVYNWWYPSERALRGMLTAAGFTDISTIGGRDSGFISSDRQVDNASAYPTGTIDLRATGPGKRA